MLDAYRYVMQHPVMVAEWITDHLCISLIAIAIVASLIALKGHKTDIAMVFGTDASIAKYGWHVYSDDKSFFPPYDLTPYVRKNTLVKYPEIAAECRKVWQKLNAEVDIEKMEPGEVAHKYLYQRKLKR